MPNVFYRNRKKPKIKRCLGCAELTNPQNFSRDSE